VDFNRLKLFYADQGYSGEKMQERVKCTFKALGLTLAIIKKIHQKAFVALPKRWIVKRTFGWFNLYCRLSKDYKYITKSAETMIHITMIHIMLKKLS